jgi:hypothetical protein
MLTAELTNPDNLDILTIVDRGTNLSSGWCVSVRAIMDVEQEGSQRRSYVDPDEQGNTIIPL